MSKSKFSHNPVSVKSVNTKYRKIITDIPVPESIPLIEKMYALEPRSCHGQFPIIWDSAYDFLVKDRYGNCWIDFTSTIFLANAGHANDRIVNGLKKLLSKPLLHTYIYPNHERIEYLEYLIKNTPKQFEKAFLLSAGTEATEAAFKLMRLNGEKIGKKKGGIICFDGAYHGRTLGAQFMSGSFEGKKWAGYLDPNIHHLAFPYPWSVECLQCAKTNCNLCKNNMDAGDFFFEELERLSISKNLNLKTDICGIMLETFQGWGAIFYPQKFLDAVKKFASQNDILIAFDEMQAGFGRTGKLFGYMNYDIEPDLLCCGKGSSSSLPLSLVLGPSSIMDLPDYGSMSSTHTANPASCVAGHESLKAIIEDKLLENAIELGKIFKEKLLEIQNEFPEHIKYVFSKGLVASLIFINRSDEKLSSLCSKICERAFQSGLLTVHTGRESIKLAPPLSISKDGLLEGLEVLEESIKIEIEKL